MKYGMHNAGIEIRHNAGIKYGIIVRGAPATASVPGSESDEDTSNHCSSSSTALSGVTINYCSHTIIICRLEAQEKEYHHPRLSRGPDQASLWIRRE